MRSLFKEGGPYKIRRTRREQYEMSIPLPTDAEGRSARGCPSPTCSPGYLNVKSGTGITENQKVAFCPYCRFTTEPGKFFTPRQLQYAKDVMKREALAGMGDMVRDALGIGSSGKRTMGEGLIKLELSVKASNPPPVHRPFEEALQRTLICPKCGLDHGVFGLAVWCPDCGADIFLTHVATELKVLETMLSDIPRRRKDLGHRIAVRDVENCLEDTVSVYEAILKAMVVRELGNRGTDAEDIQDILKRRVGNKLQSVLLSQETIEQLLAINLFESLPQSDIDRLRQTFEKRHPITHNLGVVDGKYLERLRTAERQGREILVTPEEVSKVITIVLKIVSEFHRRLFHSSTEEII
jgi:hypothetical protein